MYKDIPKQSQNVFNKVDCICLIRTFKIELKYNNLFVLPTTII